MGRSLVVGGISGAISKTAIAPVERIKIILQVQASHPDINPSNVYKGPIDCLIRQWKDQPAKRSIVYKPIPLYRGNTVNVMRYFPMQAISFAFKSRIRKFFYSVGKAKRRGKISVGGEIWRSCLSGGLAGVVGLSVMFPLDLARTRMTTDVGQRRKNKGAFRVLGRILRSEGIFALYKGYWPSVAGIFPYRAVYFGFYDLAKRYLMKDDPKKYGFFFRWGISQTTSVFSQFVAYPFDTVRRRMMLVSKDHMKYSSSFDCFRKTVSQEGVLALFHGAGTNVIRSVGASICLVLFDDIGKFLFCDEDYGSH